MLLMGIDDDGSTTFIPKKTLGKFMHISDRPLKQSAANR